MAKIPSVPKHARRPHARKNLRTLTKSHISCESFIMAAMCAWVERGREKMAEMLQHQNLNHPHYSGQEYHVL